MTLDQFKELYANEIKLGVVTIGDGFIIADRWNGVDFLTDKNTMARIQAHIRKMGYTKSYGVGHYQSPENTNNMGGFLTRLNMSENQYNNHLDSLK